MQLPNNFWPDHYREPASEIARVVQLPIYKITPEAVIAAFVRDERRKKHSRKIQGVAAT